MAHVLSEVSYIVCSWEKRDQLRAVHVSDLKHAQLEHDDPRRLLTPGDAPEYVIQKIHTHRIRNGIREYSIEWGGYRASRDWTWEPEESLQQHAPEILRRYNTLTIAPPAIPAWHPRVSR